MFSSRFSLFPRSLMLALWMLIVVGCSSAMPVEKPEEITQEAAYATALVEETQTAKEAARTAEMPTEAPAAQQPTRVSEATKAPEATPLPEAVSPAPTATAAAPHATALADTQAPATPAGILPSPSAARREVIVEGRTVELEYPSTLRLGDTDIIRLALIPSVEGYVLQADFPEHPIITTTIAVQRPADYEVSAVARLDSVGFTLSPEGEQERSLPLGERVTWRWSLTPRHAGQQRLAVVVLLRWKPKDGSEMIQSEIYSRSLEVAVTSFLGLTRNQAMFGGFIGLIFGGGLGLAVIVGGGREPRRVLRMIRPNPALSIEPRPGLALAPYEQELLQALFHHYSRLTIESEFLSGYSGARAFLAQPIRADGRADAHTIVKIGERTSIEREYQNYERFVKDTLPPITARIQHLPVTVRNESRAALRYTFIGAPGHAPRSLRQALLDNPDPALLHQLFETFGPNWWTQRRPYTFRLALEYDRLLPTHLVIEPARGRGRFLDGKTVTIGDEPAMGEIVTLEGFRQIEHRPEGGLSLRGESPPGQPPLRLRWLSTTNPNGATGKIVANRETLLREIVQGFDLFGLPDPLEGLPSWLNETIHGSQSTIHGDLNLENILVGPGNFMWLIDFAQTRDGPPLFDFAHLEAEIIAHVIAPNIPTPQAYLDLLRAEPAAAPNPFYRLRAAIGEIAAHCLLNPLQRREIELARLMACLGALKFSNLDSHAKHLLYLTAAHTVYNL